MISQSVNIAFNVVGDGVSTQQFLDLTKALEAEYGYTPFQNSPAGDIVVLQTPTTTISGVTYTSTAFVVKNVVVITWSGVIPAYSPAINAGGANIILGY